MRLIGNEVVRAGMLHDAAGLQHAAHGAHCRSEIGNMLQYIDRKDDVKDSVPVWPQLFSAQGKIRQIINLQPFSKAETDLRIGVEAAATGLDRHNFHAPAMEDERNDSDPGTDLEHALSTKIDTLKQCKADCGFAKRGLNSRFNFDYGARQPFGAAVQKAATLEGRSDFTDDYVIG